MKQKKITADHLPFRVLAFDPAYQREVSAAKVRKLIKNWKEEALGVIHVSMRAGKAYVIDGQHRVRAAMEQGLGDMKVPCRVYRGLSVEEEAQRFLYLNDSKNVSSHDRYKAGLAAGDPTCIGIRDTLAHYGLKVGEGGAEGTVRCVAQIKPLYEKSPTLLDSVCLTLTEAWGTRSSAFEKVVVGAIGQVLARYDGDLDQGQLVKKLAGYRGGPSALAGDARGYADFRPIGVTRAAAELIRDTYNKGKTSKALPPL